MLKCWNSFSRKTTCMLTYLIMDMQHEYCLCSTLNLMMLHLFCLRWTDLDKNSLHWSIPNILCECFVASMSLFQEKILYFVSCSAIEKSLRFLQGEEANLDHSLILFQRTVLLSKNSSNLLLCGFLDAS